MFYRSERRAAAVVLTGVALALVCALAVLAPASADDDAAAAGNAPSTTNRGLGPIASSPIWSGMPISRGVPISRGMVLVPIPLWCNWPTPVPPPLPPGQPTPVPPTPVPSPTPGGMASAATYTICARSMRTVPLAVQQEAMAEPWKIYGYNMRLNPNTPYHPLWNPLRTQLGLMNPNVAYHPCNPVVWKANCP